MSFQQVVNVCPKISDRTYVLSLNLTHGSSPSTAIIRKYKETGTSSLENSSGFTQDESIEIDGLTFYIDKISEDNLGYNIVATDIRRELFNKNIYRNYNIYDTNTPLGNIYDENSLFYYSELPLTWDEVIDDLTNFCNTLGYQLFNNLSSEKRTVTAPSMNFGYTNLNNIIQSICSYLGAKWTTENEAIIIKDTGSDDFSTSLTFVRFQNNFNSNLTSGYTVLGERELVEYKEPATIPSGGLFISGSYYTYDINTGTTQKFELNDYSYLDGLELNAYLLPNKGWVSDVNIPDNALVGLMVDKKEFQNIFDVATGENITGEYSWLDNNSQMELGVDSEAGTLNNFLLSIPNLTCMVEVKTDYKFKTFDYRGSTVTKAPIIQLVSYKNEDYDRSLPSYSNVNRPFRTVSRLLDPEDKQIINVTDIDGIRNFMFENGNDLTLQVIPKKIDLKRGIVWVSIRDLMVPTEVFGNISSVRGNLGADGIVDISMAETTLIKSDVIGIKYVMPDVEDIIITYCLKQDKLKKVSGNGSKIINLSNAIKITNNNGEGFNSFGVPWFSNQDLRDDSETLQNIADYLYNSDNYITGNNYYAGTDDIGNFFDCGNVSNMNIDFISGITDVALNSKKNMMTPYFSAINQQKLYNNFEQYSNEFIKPIFQDSNNISGIKYYDKTQIVYDEIISWNKSSTPIIENQQSKKIPDNVAGSVTSSINNQGTHQFSGDASGRAKEPDITGAIIEDVSSYNVSDSECMHITSPIKAKMNGNHNGIIFTPKKSYVPDLIPIEDDGYNAFYPTASSEHQHILSGASWLENTGWTKFDYNNYDSYLSGGGNIAYDFLDEDLKTNLDDTDNFNTQFSNLTSITFQNEDGTYNNDLRLLTTGEWCDVSDEDDVDEKVKIAPLLVTYIELEHEDLTGTVKGYVPLMML